MGVPEGWSGAEGADPGTDRLQHGGDDAPGRARRLWTGLPSRGSGGHGNRGGEAGPGSGGLVPAAPCVPPLLSEPPAALAGLRARDRGASLSRVGASALERNGPSDRIASHSENGLLSPCKSYGLISECPSD